MATRLPDALCERVFAILCTKESVAQSFGDGTYVGDLPIPEWVAGPDFAGIESPCIELDSGGIVFGIECWWLHEAKKAQFLDGLTVEPVDYPTWRREQCEKLNVPYDPSETTHNRKPKS